MCRQVLENISERKENYLGSLMNRATCEQTAPGSKVSFCIKWVLLLWRSRCPHSFKRQTPRRNTLSLLLFETSSGEPIWRLDTCIYSLLVPLCTKFSLEEPLLSRCKRWPSQLCCHCSATTLWHNTLLLQLWRKNSSQWMPFHWREHLWHREWPWLITFKDLLNPAQGITKMISQQMGWSVEVSSKSNSLPHHVP